MILGDFVKVLMNDFRTEVSRQLMIKMNTFILYGPLQGAFIQQGFLTFIAFILFLTVPVQSEERRGCDDGARRVGRAHQADCGVQGQNVRGEARRRGELETTRLSVTQ